MPVYKPPLRGCPAGRVGGGTRGIKTEQPTLIALTPDHVALTVQEKPSFYWYLSKPTEFKLEFVLIDNNAVKPLIEKQITTPIQNGINCVRLADLNVRLAPGMQYKWFIVLVLDPEHRSKDIIASGAIERVEIPQALQRKLAQASKVEALYLYAENGIWCDAMSTISELIDAAPNDVNLRKMRASLLEQVGLSEVAEK